ncbi:MAG: hypothetical protein V4584_08815 [Verrucomicrobiota bacterium]
MRPTLLRLIPVLALGAVSLLSMASSTAATVTISVGLSGISDGLDVLGYSGEPISFTAAVGGYDPQTGQFIQFGEQTNHFGSMSGWSTTAISPALLNHSEIFLAIALPSSGGGILSSGAFVILASNTHPSFGDVSSALTSPIFSSGTPSTLTAVATGPGGLSFDGDNVRLSIPEPGPTGLVMVGLMLAAGLRGRRNGK